jgi:hypothetical protein
MSTNQPVEAIGGGTRASAAASSRMPWVLLGAGVVLLGLALALLFRPAGLRVRRRDLPSASVR